MLCSCMDDFRLFCVVGGFGYGFWACSRLGGRVYRVFGTGSGVQGSVVPGIHTYRKRDNHSFCIRLCVNIHCESFNKRKLIP